MEEINQQRHLMTISLLLICFIEFGFGTIHSLTHTYGLREMIEMSVEEKQTQKHANTQREHLNGLQTLHAQCTNPFDLCKLCCGKHQCFRVCFFYYLFIFCLFWSFSFS